MRPTSNPPPPTSRKLRPASHTENAPLTTTATATLKAARPVPSLTRLSPPTTVPTRSGTPNLPKIASAATGSVGGEYRPEDEGRRPRQANQGVRDHGDRPHRGEHEPHGHQQDRVGHLQKAGELGEQGRGRVQEDERLDLVHLRSHPRDSRRPLKDASDHRISPVQYVHLSPQAETMRGAKHTNFREHFFHEVR